MKLVIKKHTTDTSEEDNLVTLKPRKKSANIKTISIFMDNLDTQISKSYAKLRRNRDKLSSTKKEQVLQDSTMPCLFSPNQSSHIHPSLYESFPRSSLLRESVAQEKEIVLLDNKEVMQYIHLVYDMYNIKDPYSQQGTDKCFSTNKKIRTFKDKIQKEIGSASTTKNYEIRKSIELNPFSLSRTHHYKKQSAFTAKVQAISLHPRQIQRDGGSCKSSTYRFQNKNVMAKKQKINIVSHRDNSRSNAVSSVPQFFRFCFMCQQPILQCNLQFHEQSCESLKQAFNKTFEQLLAILDQKIAYLISQINSLLLEKSQSRIAEEFATIKATVKKWISSMPVDSFAKSNIKQRQDKTSKLNMNWRGQFNRIQQTISQSVCSSFQLIHKLQWFSKLRDNMSKKYLSPNDNN